MHLCALAQKSYNIGVLQLPVMARTAYFIISAKTTVMARTAYFIISAKTTQCAVWQGEQTMALWQADHSE